MRNATLCRFLSIMTLSVCSLLLPVFAQDTPPDVSTVPDISGRWYAEGILAVGAGLDDHKVGETSENDDITISGGGGFGGVLALGYGLSPRFDVNFSLGIEVSALQPEVKNAEGDFQRSFLNAGVKYRIPVSVKGHLKLGAGAGYYMPSDLDLDLSEVAGGAHNIYSYDPAAGFHISVEYEGFFREKISWNAGLKYYSVAYELTAVKSNGVTIPMQQLPDEVRKELSELDGSGIDVILSFIYYF